MTGARQRCDWLVQWKNGSRHWAGVERRSETKKGTLAAGNLDQKS
jgi:hypothetical protein